MWSMARRATFLWSMTHGQIDIFLANGTETEGHFCGQWLKGRAKFLCPMVHRQSDIFVANGSQQNDIFVANESRAKIYFCR